MTQQPPISRQDISDRERLPENLCANYACGHPRNSHLGEAPIKGLPKEDDSGWCTKPAGTCIFGSCACATFVESDCAAISDAEQAFVATRVTFLVEYNDDPEITCLFCADAQCDGAIKTIGTSRAGQKATRWHGVHRRCLPEEYAEKAPHTPREKKPCSAWVHQISSPNKERDGVVATISGWCDRCGETYYGFPIDLPDIGKRLLGKG